jgi:MFS family permease
MELIANKHRPFFVAFLFMSTFPFAAFGPVIARAFVRDTALQWRWNYYLNLIVNAIAGVLFYVCYHPPSYKMLHEGKTVTQELKQLDYGGIVLFSGGLTSLILGISWGGGKYAWNSYNVILPIVLGFVALVALGFYGTKSDPNF